MSDLDNRFDYHRPTPERVAAHEAVREGCRAFAHFIEAKVPNGRERSLAITKIEEAMFWMNAGIAREAVA
jgi:hypothetical protein